MLISPLLETGLCSSMKERLAHHDKLRTYLLRFLAPLLQALIADSVHSELD